MGCKHFKKCSGCSLDEGANRPPIYERALEFFKNRGLLELPLVVGNLEQWRVRAKLAVRGSVDNPKIGLFKKNSHDVEEIPHCKVHHPLINQAVEIVQKEMIELGVEPYDETLGVGLLRYIQCVVNRQTHNVQLTLIVNSKEDVLKLAACIQSAKPEFWHSIWINVNRRQTNRILGDEWVFVSGKEEFKEKVLDTSVYFSPSSFSQANLDLFEKIVADIISQVKEGARVVEFYAGVGTISLPLSKKCSFLTAIESIPEAKEMFEKAAMPNTSFLVGPVCDHTQEIEKADTIIVDPPRKGLDRALLNALQKVEGSKTLFYVSCGFESFERDCDELLKAGWSLKSAKSYLLFPGSDHLETLAIFTNGWSSTS